MIVAATGHRPEKLFPELPREAAYSDEARTDLVDFAFKIIRDRRQGDLLMISGMALGWDQAVAEASLKLGIPFIAAVPFVGQEKLWSGRQQTHYRWLLERALRVEIICPHSLTVAYGIRNQWMIDKANAVLALYDGTEGGTRHAVEYATESWDMPIENVWTDWQQWKQRHDFQA